MNLAVVDGCEKLNLSSQNYKLLLLYIRSFDDYFDCNKVAETLSIEL